VMDKHSRWQRYAPLARHEALPLQARLPASEELDDLLQEGGIGLLNAVERYDALQGTAFTPSAIHSIRGPTPASLRTPELGHRRLPTKPPERPQDKRPPAP
ncbi:sigma factor, partial [Escherichia coli]|uniref:sigma factor n=1 Tax=Escherichia coli TaxID=562 RepID=UPI003D76E980